MKKSKAQSPQELYRSRKQQEEQERLASLPPGLVNHGNTCFMNSVLQGLIATRLLSRLVYFEPIPSEIQHHSNNALVPQRSPQLTNGHAWAGSSTQAWVEGMPIGDVFVNLMERAWSVQRNRERENLSPRPLLMALGKKYDQYLDFAQQDAHEFLRILLDAMRMEEFDVIKKRQPPRRTVRRRTTMTPVKPSMNSDVQSTRPPPEAQSSNDIPLMSFSDMLFGGKLTSLLICQKCKHISHTYEDFNDLSLSIKAEDYAKEKKRDRLKKLAKKMGMGLGRTGMLKPTLNAEAPSSIPPETRIVSDSVIQTPAPTKPESLVIEAHSTSHSSGLRSSSVPPSPSPHPEPPLSIDTRRRSFDNMRGSLDSSEPKRGSDSDEGDVVVVHHSTSEPLSSEGHKIEFAKDPEVERDHKAKLGWSEKLGRRLSLGLGRSSSGKDKDKSKRRSRSRPRTADESNAPLPLTQSTTSESESAGPDIRLFPPTLTPNRRQEFTEDETIKPYDKSKRFSHSAVSEDGKWRDPISAPSETSGSAASSSVSLPKFPQLQKAKSTTKQPKPSKAELEYLRQILADVTTSTTSFPHFPGFYSNSNASAPSTSSPPASPQSGASWFPKLGLPLTSVEDCLKMFTAVEVLDGDNMVGCRTCWKIANGCYKPRGERAHGSGEGDGDDADESDDEEDKHEKVESSPPPLQPVLEEILRPASAPSGSSTVLSETTSSTVSTHASTSFSSLSSLNTSESETAPPPKMPRPLPPPPLLLRSQSYGDPSSPPLPSKNVPLISTTDTDGPYNASPLTARPINGVGFPKMMNSDTPESYTPSQASESKESLLSIPVPRSRKSSVSSRSEDGLISTTEDETSDDGADSDVLPSATHPHATLPPKPKPKKSKPPKPTMMQPAYKRYLIATPPPILVIHLKRFQQTSKTPMVSFSSGFKKLEDYVAFPEYLDLTPFLTPKKEDFGLGRRATVRVKDLRKERRKDKERCMYRLYAVVVHIGNMLGGHYVAYTALPSDEESPGEGQSKTRKWTYISDTIVRLTTIEEVLKAKAYICLYERV